MNYKMMGRFLSQILFLEGVLMLPALGISLYCGEQPAVKGFLISVAVSIFVATCDEFFRGLPALRFIASIFIL